MMMRLRRLWSYDHDHDGHADHNDDEVLYTSNDEAP